MADERAYNVDTDRLRKRILQAISGPAKFVFRTIADGWEEPGPQWQSRAVMSVVEPALRQAYLDGHDAGFAAANVDDPWAGHPNPAAPLDHELRVQVRRAIAKSYGYESWAAVTAVEDGESEGITGAADAAISVFAPVLAERDLLRWLHAEAMWHLGQAGEVLKAVREERDAAAEKAAKRLAEPDVPDHETRRFHIVGTGHPMPDVPLQHLGSVQLDNGTFVFHVFEEIAI